MALKGEGCPLTQFLFRNLQAFVGKIVPLFFAMMDIEWRIHVNSFRARMGFGRGRGCPFFYLIAFDTRFSTFGMFFKIVLFLLGSVCDRDRDWKIYALEFRDALLFVGYAFRTKCCLFFCLVLFLCPEGVCFSLVVFSLWLWCLVSWASAKFWCLGARRSSWSITPPKQEMLPFFAFLVLLASFLIQVDWEFVPSKGHLFGQFFGELCCSCQSCFPQLFSEELSFYFTSIFELLWFNVLLVFACCGPS